MLVDGLFFAVVMALEFDIHVLAAKDVDETFESCRTIFVRDGPGQGAMLTAGKTNQAARVSGQFVFCDRALAFGSPEFHARHQPAEVLVACASFGEKRISYAG